MEYQSRYWNGVTVRHVVQHLGPGRVWHDLSSKDPTVAILLDQVGGYCDARLNVNRPTPRTRFDAGHTVFVPADVSVWGYSDGIESTRDLRLSFDADVPASILGDEFEVVKTRDPVLMVYDDRIARCASLLAEECREPENRMYGESLTTALTALLFTRWKHPRSERAKGLAPWQLRRVLEFFEAHFAEDVSLRELADLVGLSQSQFARAFTASTGDPPHRWFVTARQLALAACRCASRWAQGAADWGSSIAMRRDGWRGASSREQAGRGGRGRKRRTLETLVSGRGSTLRGTHVPFLFAGRTFRPAKGARLEPGSCVSSADRRPLAVVAARRRQRSRRAVARVPEPRT